MISCDLSTEREGEGEEKQKGKGKILVTVVRGKDVGGGCKGEDGNGNEQPALNKLRN